MKHYSVLFVHGIMGNNRIFEPLTAALADRPDVSVELVGLTGHGGDALDFARSSMREWQECLDRAVEAAQRSCDGLVLVGHSMGGLLSVRSALTYPLKVRGIFALAMPLKMRMTWRYARNSVNAALGRHMDDPMVRAAREMSGVSDRRLPLYALTAPRFVELFGKAAETVRLLDRTTVPLLAVQSRGDGLVSTRSSRCLERAGKPLLELERAGHFYYPEDELRLVINRFLEFINNVLPMDKDGEAGKNA